jgi:AcrR family transcriptional regulator
VPTQAERTEATRSRLISTARRLFAYRGFAGTSTEEILEMSSVSRGAMYHQFASKKELFRYTFEAVEEDLTARVMAAAMHGSDPVSRLRMGFGAFLDQCRHPDVLRIVMLDGPTVLGWDTWHEIDGRYAFGVWRQLLGAAVEPDAVEPLAHLVMGAVMRAGMVVARADNPVAAKLAMTTAFEKILAGV